MGETGGIAKRSGIQHIAHCGAESLAYRRGITAIRGIDCVLGTTAATDERV